MRNMNEATNNPTSDLPITPLGHEPMREEIAIAAYLMWESAGKPSGRERDFWLRAEAKLKQEYQLLGEKLAELTPSEKPATPATRGKLARPKKSSTQSGHASRPAG